MHSKSRVVLVDEIFLTGVNVGGYFFEKLNALCFIYVKMSIFGQTALFSKHFVISAVLFL
jgi:hypothetical protein